MKTTLRFFMIFMVGLMFVSCQSEKNPSLKTEEDKTFYSIGLMFGTKLKELSLAQNELDLLVKGLRDSAAGKKAEVDPTQYQAKMQDLFRERMTKVAQDQKTKGKEYLEKFVAGGGQKTESGLAYKIEAAGEGKNPGAQDTVEVHYHGTLIDGTVFDSSKDRGKTISFPLDRVIKGWTEGLQLVKPGGKIKLVIPSELAYGDNGAPPKIPGGATLVFDVELFKVTPYEAPKAAPAAKSKKK